MHSSQQASNYDDVARTVGFILAIQPVFDEQRCLQRATASEKHCIRSDEASKHERKLVLERKHCQKAQRAATQYCSWNGTLVRSRQQCDITEGSNVTT